MGALTTLATGAAVAGIVEWAANPRRAWRRLVAALRLYDALGATSAVVWRAWDRVPTLVIDLSEGGGLLDHGLAGGQLVGADLRSLAGLSPHMLEAVERVLRTGRTETITTSPNTADLGYTARARQKQYLVQLSRSRARGVYGIVAIAFDVTGLTEELAVALDRIEDLRAVADTLTDQVQTQILRADTADRAHAAIVKQRTAERELAHLVPRT